MSSISPGGIQQLFLPQLLNDAFNAMMEQLHEHLLAQGYQDLRPTHFMNVFRFMDCDGTPPTTLARRAGMTPQAMGDLVTHLERCGYVERAAHPSDGRIRVVVWAQRGQEAAGCANKFFQELEQKWAVDLGQEDLRSLTHALTVLRHGPLPSHTQPRP